MDAVMVSGLKITYQRAGSGDALVLLHGGFGFDSRAWQPQFDDLVDEFTVVAWDAPGCLILAGAYAGWAGSLPADEVQRRLQRISEEITHRPADWLAKYLPGMLTESAPKEMVEHTLALMSDIHPEASLTMLRAMADADLRDILPKIDAPTLVLHGDLDARAPLSVGQELHERIPGSQLVVLPGVGHLSNVEAASAFNREVRSFVRAVGTH